MSTKGTEAENASTQKLLDLQRRPRHRLGGCAPTHTDDPRQRGRADHPVGLFRLRYRLDIDDDCPLRLSAAKALGVEPQSGVTSSTQSAKVPCLWYHHSMSAYQTDSRIDEYIQTLPGWQQEMCRQVRDLVHAADPDVTETIKRTNRPYFTLNGNICALLGTKDHLTIFIYDPIVPDPEGIINQGQGNQTARAI